MAQFDVYKHARGGPHSLLVDLQTDLLARLDTRIVAPLVPVNRYDEKVAARLHPLVTIKNTSYVVLMHLLAAIEASELGTRVGSIAASRSELVGALDLLITES